MAATFQTVSHNKKRNTGLVYEFFARYIGQAVIEGRDQDIAKARLLVRKHFNKSTSLFKELQLFKVLTESNCQTRDAAIRLVNRIRETSKQINENLLSVEKTSLVHEIHGFLGDSKFFDQPVKEYRKYATIQTLLNYWRNQENQINENLSRYLELEENLICDLTRRASTEERGSNSILEMNVEDIDKLTVSLLSEKVNKKFSSVLNQEQKNIIQWYVFSKDNEACSQKLTEALSGLRARGEKTLSQIEKEFSKDEMVISKLQEARALLEAHKDIHSPTDEMITFYLSLPKLEQELKNE